MFGTEIPPFFFFSGNIISVMSSVIMAPSKRTLGKVQGGKPRLVKTITHFNTSMHRFIYTHYSHTKRSQV